MRVCDVSQITQRMVFLRMYEILLEANQSVVDRRDMPLVDNSRGAKEWSHCDAGYPFCYFTGEVLADLLEQPIIWREQHITIDQALRLQQPDLDLWLTDDVRDICINDFFAWQPHTLRVQELVDDVKQRVLDVVDAIHGAERIQQMSGTSMLEVVLQNKSQRKIVTGGVVHSLRYRANDQGFEPVLHDSLTGVTAKWKLHALIHGMWLAGQEAGEVRLDAQESGPEVMQAPLYLV